jgi:hypothetical protein
MQQSGTPQRALTYAVAYALARQREGLIKVTRRRLLLQLLLQLLFALLRLGLLLLLQRGCQDHAW